MKWLGQGCGSQDSWFLFPGFMVWSWDNWFNICNLAFAFPGPVRWLEIEG